MANLSNKQEIRHPRAGGDPSGVPDARLRGHDKWKSPEIAAGALLVVAAFGISLFFGGFRDIHYAPAALCMLGFTCLCIIPSFWRGLEMPRGAAAVLMFAFWLFVTLSLSWSSVPYASLVTYLVILACPFAFFGPLLSMKREEMAMAIFILLMTGITMLGGWAVMQAVLFSDVYGSRAHHPLPSPNNLAGLLNLGLLPALALFLKGGERNKTMLYAAAAAVIFAGLCATGSRGGLISAVFAAGLLAAVMRPDVKKAGGVIGAGLVIFAALSFTDGMDFAGRLFGAVTPGQDDAMLARFAIWMNTWRLIQDHMLLGTGLGTFYLYYPGYRTPGADNSTGNWAHMDPLQYWAEMGVMAPLLFYAIAIAVAVRTATALRAAPHSEDKALMTGLFCGLFALILHTHFDFHLYVMPILITSGIWLALWYILSAKVLDAPSFAAVGLEQWQKPFMAVVTLAIASLLSVMAVSSALGQYHLVKAQNLLQQGMTEQFTTEIARAEKWAPRSFIDPEVQLAGFYINLLSTDTVRIFSPEEQQSLFVQTNELLDAVQGENPPWAEIDYKRGQLYAVAPDGAAPDAGFRAVDALSTAIRKNPMHMDARALLAELYIRQGKIEQAYTVLGDGLRYPHDANKDQEFRRRIEQMKPLLDVKRAYDAKKETAP